jgi:maltose alpha-D-glucosyltransferase/alpha-amylase
MLIAEANQWPADVRPYFGNGDECHMAFNFPLMPRMFMALQQEDRHPITEIVRQTPDIPENCQWGLFLRNHDELTLEMVTDEERDYMYQAYAADPRMRINVGIRRRLAPLVENSRRRIELLHSLLFSLPGTPVIYYGDEIGMGDNIYLGDRNGVRTPMQWTGDRNGGFSRTDPARLYAPLIMDPVYGYPAINVEAQERSPFSLLSWMKRMIALRKQFKVFGRGSLEFLGAENRKILAYVRRHEDELVLCVANLSRAVQPVELDLSAFAGMTPVEMLGLTEFPKIGTAPYFLTLPPYYFYWFRLQMTPTPAAAQRAVEFAPPVDVLPAFFMGVAWDTLLEGNVRTLIERESLVPFLLRQRWFGGKARAVRSARFIDWGVVRRGEHPSFLTIVEVAYADGPAERYLVPLAIVTGEAADTLYASAPQSALARVTGARKGLVIDGAADDPFSEGLLEVLDGRWTVRAKHGVVRARPTPAFGELRGDGPLVPKRIGAEQSNTSIGFGDRLIVKLFRRLENGPNPDVEIGEQLTTHTSFRRAPRVAASIEYEAPGEPIAHLAVAQQRIACQADGWHHALAELGRYYDDVEHRQDAPSQMFAGAYIKSAQTLGRRTAELHLALAGDTSSDAFAPEPWTRDDIAGVVADAAAQARQAGTLVESAVTMIPDDVSASARHLLARADAAIKERFDPQSGRLPDGTVSRIRIHGDYHLGQILWAEGDFYILDFEGEPARPLEERRRKESPMKDVAGMLRSFSYAAHAAAFAHSGGRGEDLARLEPWARAWERWTSAAFLEGYLDTAGPAPFVPADPSQRQALLDLFLVDKALYELNYELNNRPDWARIPLRGLAELLG